MGEFGIIYIPHKSPRSSKVCGNLHQQSGLRFKGNIDSLARDSLGNAVVFFELVETLLNDVCIFILEWILLWEILRNVQFLAIIYATCVLHF